MNFKILAVALVIALATAAKVSLVCEQSLHADADKPFNYVLSANGGSGRYAFDVQGLPAGLRNQGAVIAGIPRTTGSFPITVRTYDDEGNYDTKTIVINVNANGRVVSSSGSGSVKVTVSDGSLAGATAGVPSWLSSFNPTGVIAATTGAAGATTGSTTTTTTATTGTTAGATGATATTIIGGATTSSTTVTTTTNKVEVGPIPAGYTPGYPTGPSSPFPTQSFPTGPSANYIPSNLPTQIQNYNYDVVTTRDTYTTTTEDVRSQAVFQRQINANKAVANLLSIIQQLTANVNGVQADIPSATQAVNQAIADQRTAQQKVVAAENANKTLTSNVETVRTQITTLQTNLGKVNGDLANAQGPIDAAYTSKATTQANLDSITARLSNYPAALDAAKQARRDALNNLDALRNKVNDLSGKIAAIQVDIDNSGPYVAAADADIANFDAQIAALLVQLDRLRQQRADAKNRSDYFKTINVTGGAQIRLLKGQIEGLNGQIAAGQAALDAANANIDKISRDISDATNTIANLKAKLSEIEIAINNAQKNKDGLSAQSTTIVQSITYSSTTLNNLLSQVPAYNNALVQAYNDGNDANDRYNQLKGVLDALKSKYLDSLTQLNDAKSALEKARSEKEIADIAVNEQIKRQGGSTVLPYSIPGTGDFGIGKKTHTHHTQGAKAGSKGTAGTRPGSYVGSGGATGVYAAGAGARPRELEGDLTHYISNSLTAGVNAATLYPFTVRWGLKGHGEHGDFGCGKSESREESGTITTVSGGKVVAAGRNGEQHTLYIGGCTKLQANKPDYDFTIGDRIQWAGHNAGRQDKKAWNVERATCYA
jgi:predicted  nucleic acid-binding Zn-ribbon protein